MTTSIKQEWHPNGQLKEETHYNGTQPANGWSSKSFYPNSQLEKEQCFSNGQLIEQKTFDENGNKTTHTIWNHRLQQMVDRPVVTPASQTSRPNVAGGCMTIYGIIEIMPWICELIDAPVQATELLAAHDLFYGYTDNDEEIEEEIETETDEEKKEEERWVLNGKYGRFSVLFERSEGYLFYYIHTPEIDNYEKARQLVERAQNRNRLIIYSTEENLLKKAAKTATPILHYLAPSSNRLWLEFELNVWGTDPVFSILDNEYTIACYGIDITNNEIPPVTSFLESLPDWDNIIKEVKQSESAFYIIQTINNPSASILKNPSPKELELFLKTHCASK